MHSLMIWKVKSFHKKPLNLVNFSFDEEHDDHIDNFLHIVRCRWDTSCFHFDRDPIYDIDDNSRVKSAELLTLEQLYMYTNDARFWQHEDDMFTNVFQPSKDGLLQPSRGNFYPCTVRYDTYPFGQLELFYEGKSEDNFQPPLW